MSEPPSDDLGALLADSLVWLLSHDPEDLALEEREILAKDGDVEAHDCHRW